MVLNEELDDHEINHTECDDMMIGMAVIENAMIVMAAIESDREWDDRDGGDKGMIECDEDEGSDFAKTNKRWTWR